MFESKKADSENSRSSWGKFRFTFGLSLFFTGILLNRFGGGSGWIDISEGFLYGAAILLFMSGHIRSRRLNIKGNLSVKIPEPVSSASIKKSK